MPVDLLRPGPTFRRAQDDHRPAGPIRLPGSACLLAEWNESLARSISTVAAICWCMTARVVALDDMWSPTVAPEEIWSSSSGANSRQHRRIGDLVSVQMENRQHRAVTNRIQELVRVPGCGERPGFRFAVAHHHADDQIGIIECRTKRMRDAVAQFAAFVDRSWNLWCAVAAELVRETRKRETADDMPASSWLFSG